jgi:hypothetical protein
MKKNQIIPIEGNITVAKMQSTIVGDIKSKDYVKNERVEWLKQLHAEWLEKRNSIVNKN